MTTPIPQPPGIPLLGNLMSIDREVPIRSWILLAQTYGELFQVNVLGRVTLIVTTRALVDELSDEKRFKKSLSGALLQLRNLAGDGLFTAHNDEHNWGVAHRLLMPAFGPAAIRGMMEDMRDICSQLLLKWERFGPETRIDIGEDFTKLTLDTIALCSMSYRMNSFYTQGQPEFAEVMLDVLKESFSRNMRPSVVQAMQYTATAKYYKDIDFMKDLAKKIIDDRRRHPVDKKDLLNAMLSGRDSQTGEGLSDDSIIQNLITFLVAGHETTSGALSFATYYLVKNPEAMRKLHAEVDEVLGDRAAVVDDLNKMPYLNAVLRETLRLQPTAPARTVGALEDTTLLNGKYAIKAGTRCLIATYIAHRDLQVWGPDAEEFRPERMLDGKFEALPPHAWQPFGNGMRACIGRAFAWQEMQLVLASVMQKFDLIMADPSYTLGLRQALTIKPRDFLVHAIPRASSRIYASPSSGLKAGVDPTSHLSAPIEVPLSAAVGDLNRPLYVLYGSNTGTSEAFAQRLASDGPSHGFRPSLGTLDSATNRLPVDGPILIITASFEGEPADNAKRFVDWLSNLRDKKLKGVQYALFGCGNTDWEWVHLLNGLVNTYQRVPKLCDQLLQENGASRVVPLGAGDASQGNFFEVFDKWEANLWNTFSEKYKTTKNKSTAGLSVKTVEAGMARPSLLRQPDAGMGIVVENHVLTKPGSPEKRHIEFKLPEDMSAHAGDYLAIIPRNPPRDVHRILARFGLSEDVEVTLSSDGPTSLPVGRVINISTLLSGYVEICQPATTRDIRILIEAASNADTKEALQKLLQSYADNILAHRISALDLTEKYKDIDVPFERFLSLLPPMRVRQYSISSSPIWNPEHVTLTVSVIHGSTADGKEEPFIGVASNFLAGLRPGDKVQMAVRPASAGFRLPSDPSIPIVMFCAGSGLAPMRGFMQERAIQKQSGRNVGQMLLFFGCHSPDEDFLYSESDLKKWIELGVLDVRPAFSRDPEASEGCKYVQDRIWHDRFDIKGMYQAGAKFFTCGSGHVACGIKSKLLEIIKIGNNISDDAVALERLETVTADRYATDIFD